MIFAGYVEVAPGKPQTGRVILKILPVTGEAKFSLGEWKKSTESGSTASVTERCNMHDKYEMPMFGSSILNILN